MPPVYKFGRIKVWLSLGTNDFTAKKGFQCAIRCLWFGFLGTRARAAKRRGKTGQELWDVPGVWTECQCLPSVDSGNQVCYFTSKFIIFMPHTPFPIRIKFIKEGKQGHFYSIYAVLNYHVLSIGNWLLSESVLAKPRNESFSLLSIVYPSIFFSWYSQFFFCCL